MLHSGQSHRKVTRFGYRKPRTWQTLPAPAPAASAGYACRRQRPPWRLQRPRQQSRRRWQQPRRKVPGGVPAQHPAVTTNKPSVRSMHQASGQLHNGTVPHFYGYHGFGAKWALQDATATPAYVKKIIGLYPSLALSCDGVPAPWSRCSGLSGCWSTSHVNVMLADARRFQRRMHRQPHPRESSSSPK